VSDSTRTNNDHIPFTWPPSGPAPTPRRLGGVRALKSILSAASGLILLGAVLLGLFLIAMSSASRPVRGVYEPSGHIQCTRSSCLPA